VQSNLGAHPGKIKNAVSLLETTFESFNFHSDMYVRRPSTLSHGCGKGKLQRFSPS
jgi:hypothetical protein